MALNKVQLIGNVGKDPEIRDSQTGKFATFRLATTDRAYTRKDGTPVPERTEWHSIIANGGIVQVIESYVRKGTKLYVEGKLRTRKYTGRDGVERTVTEVHLENMELLGGRGESQSAPAQNPYQPAPQRGYQVPVPQPAGDDLPF